MIVETEDGKTINLNVIAKWSDNINNYVAYSDSTKTNDKLDIFVSKYKVENNKYVLYAIEDKEELNKAQEFLDKYFFNGGNNE